MIQLFIDEDKKEKHHFTVRDNRGQIIYLIRGYWGKKGDRVDLLTLHGTLLLQARQVSFSPFFKFDLVANNELVGSFRKHPGLFGLRDAFFTIQPNDWIIRGDFEKLEFSTFKNQREIVRTNKLRHANALYSLKVLYEKDIPLASLLSVLLDHYSRKENEETIFNEYLQKNYNLGILNYEIHSLLDMTRKELLEKSK